MGWRRCIKKSLKRRPTHNKQPKNKEIKKHVGHLFLPNQSPIFISFAHFGQCYAVFSAFSPKMVPLPLTLEHMQSRSKTSPKNGTLNQHWSMFFSLGKVWKMIWNSKIYVAGVLYLRLIFRLLETWRFSFPCFLIYSCVWSTCSPSNIPRVCCESTDFQKQQMKSDDQIDVFPNMFLLKNLKLS